MSKKKFVLRIDDDVYQAIERWANDEFRSVNGQIEWVLHQSLRDAGRLGKSKPAVQPPDKPDKKK